MFSLDFRDKFRGYHVSVDLAMSSLGVCLIFVCQKRLSPKTRPFYWHETSVIDTKATAVILVGGMYRRGHFEPTWPD